VTFGDIAIFAILDTVHDLKTDILAPYPGLQAFYNKFAANPKLKDAIAVPAYFNTK